MHVNIECAESFFYLWNKSEVGNGLKSQITEVQRLYYFKDNETEVYIVACAVLGLLCSPGWPWVGNSILPSPPKCQDYKRVTNLTWLSSFLVDVKV